MYGIKQLLLVGIAALALGQAGCLLLAAGAVGGGAAAYGIKRGTVTRTFDANVDDTTVALQSALRDLGLPVERPRGRLNFAEIDSTLPSGAPVLLTVRPDPQVSVDAPQQAMVEVHARVFGDKAFSERLLDQVAHRLKNPAPPQPTGVPLPPPLTEAQTDEPAIAPASAKGP